jgi:cyclohexa-1,5-dienecarbonyl-CoA hydratase
MSEHVHVRRDGPRVTLTLDRPPLNVLTTAMIVALERALREADADPSARLVVVDAKGKAFSAGVDIADHVGDRIGPMMDALTSLFTTFDAVSIPTVAVLHGAVLGGGLELALGTDLAIACEDAKLGQPEIRLGLFAPPASVLLPRILGPRRALDLLLSGDTLEAAAALELGLVNAVFPRDGFADAASAWCARIERHSGAALRQAVRAARTGSTGSVESALGAVHRQYLDELMSTADAEEGLDAFQNKRGPVWKDR